MKKIPFFIGFGIILLVVTTIGLHCWIGNDVKKNIHLATNMYEGTAEQALIAFLEDERNAIQDRTHKAVWTLGQIRSEAALPILYSYYKDDPEGKTCYNKHRDTICQYEIYKAIQNIENGKLFSHARLKNNYNPS